MEESLKKCKISGWVPFPTLFASRDSDPKHPPTPPIASCLLPLAWVLRPSVCTYLTLYYLSCLLPLGEDILCHRAQ